LSRIERLFGRHVLAEVDFAKPTSFELTRCHVGEPLFVSECEVSFSIRMNHAHCDRIAGTSKGYRHVEVTALTAVVEQLPNVVYALAQL